MNSIIRPIKHFVCEVDGKVVGCAYTSQFRARSADQYSVEVSVYVATEYHQLYLRWKERDRSTFSTVLKTG